MSPGHHMAKRVHFRPVVQQQTESFKYQCPLPFSMTEPKVFAYCRVSTVDQDTMLQERAILRVHPEAVIRTEKASASSRDGRPILATVIDMLREGDKLVVWRLDRLARNMRDLLQLVQEIEARGATLEILDQRIDTSTASGKAFLQMLGVFAEFETNLRKERQMEGIKKAKAQGKYRGRRPSFDKARIAAMLAKGVSHSAIARELGCSTKTVQRAKHA